MSSAPAVKRVSSLAPRPVSWSAEARTQSAAETKGTSPLTSHSRPLMIRGSELAGSRQPPPYPLNKREE